MCIAKAINVAITLRQYFDEYTYLKRLYPIPSEWDLKQLANDLEFLVNSCITDEKAKERFKTALDMVKLAIEYRNKGMYDEMMHFIKQAYAQIDLGAQMLKYQSQRW